MARIVRCKRCELYKLERKEKWYEHVHAGEVKLLWDMNIQCDNVVEARRPDMIVVSKKEDKCIIVDVAIPGDSGVHEKEFEKAEKYPDLKREIRRLRGMENIDVVLVVVVALGRDNKKPGQWIEKLEIRVRIGLLQKTTLLGTARILRKVQGTLDHLF